MVTLWTVTGAELMVGTLRDVHVFRSRVIVTVVLAGVRLSGGEYAEESLLGTVHRTSPTVAWAVGAAMIGAAANARTLNPLMTEFRLIGEPPS